MLSATMSRRSASAENISESNWLCGLPRGANRARRSGGVASNGAPYPVRYASTRGEAPPLGFVEATLAGLARDGGLYVPAAWPRLDAATIAGFAGRPYPEVAVEVIRPFVGGA